MSKSKDLARRVANIKAAKIPHAALDRSRLLKSIEVTKNKLEIHIAEQEAVISHARSEIKAAKIQVKSIECRIKRLAPPERKVVTEHALLRYLERYEGVNLQSVHDKILALPQTDKIMAHNTVVTVFPALNDHFNLAENESK